MNKSIEHDIKLLEDSAKALRETLLFIRGRQEKEYEEYIEKMMKLYMLTGRTGYLINVCRVEKRMHGFTDRAREVAAEAFLKNQNEINLVFYLDSHVSNVNMQRAQKFIQSTFDKIDRRKTSLRPIIDIYMAGIANRIGDYSKSTEMIKRFKKEYSGSVLWQSEILIDDPELGKTQKYFIENNIEVQGEGKKCKYVISVSCNLKYFELYAQTFVESIIKNCAGHAHLHITFVNLDICCIEEKLAIWNKHLSLSYTLIKVPIVKEVAVSAISRMIVLSELIRTFEIPVIYCEIDSYVKQDLGVWVDLLGEANADHLIRRIGMLMPWQMYTCGFGLINCTESGFKLASLIEKFTKGLFNVKERLVWADQSVLEGAIRFSSILDGNYKKIEPLVKDINDTIFTPTGGTELKLLCLNNMSR